MGQFLSWYGVWWLDRFLRDHWAHVLPNGQRLNRKTTLCWETRLEQSQVWRLWIRIIESWHFAAVISHVIYFSRALDKFYKSKFFSETYYHCWLRPKFVQSYFCSKERKYWNAWHTVLCACVWFSSLKAKILLEQMIWTERVHSTWVTGNEVIIRLLIWPAPWKSGTSGNDSHHREDFACPHPRPQQFGRHVHLCTWTVMLSALSFSH